MVKSEAMLVVDALDNAIDHLGMIDHFLTHIESPWRWKWVCIATHQALYSFAVCALSGTAPSLNVSDRRHRASMAQVRWIEGRTEDEIAAELNVTLVRLQELLAASPRVIGIHEAMERMQEKDCLPWMKSNPLILSKDEKWALRKLIGDFRNEFEHFMPKTWIILTSGFPKIVGHALRVIDFIALESNCITYTEPDIQEMRIRSAIDKIRKSLASLEESAIGEHRMYLHDAMVMILKEHGAPLHPDDIASEVNQRRLYTMREGSPVEKHQIHARVSTNRHIFTRENGLIGLVEWHSTDPSAT